jgi:hypothetical protein
MNSRFKSLLVFFLASSTPALAASDEQLAARAERIVAEMAKNAVAENEDVTVGELSLIRYREPMGTVQGVAARITSVSRRGSTLYVFEEFSRAPRVVPYFTKLGAHEALQKIVSGLSIDVSDCMTPDSLVSRSLEPSDLYCTTSVYTTRVDCSRITRVPVGRIDPRLYALVDIDRSPLTETRTSCRRERF